MELLFSGRVKSVTVLSLSPLGPSAGKRGLKCGNCTQAREGGFRFSGFPEHSSSSTFCSQTCLYSSFLWLFRQGCSEHCPGCPGLMVRTERDKRKLSIAVSGQRSQENS